jgi:hypothetical protein
VSASVPAFSTIASVEPWGAALYGDPCTQCGWSWPRDAVSNIDTVSNIDYVRSVPEAYARLLDGRSGAERHPDLAWSVTGYVCHVGDNLRLWAERVAGVLRGADPRVGSYDQDALAAARGYAHLPLAGALWSLRFSVGFWVEVLTEATDAGVVVVHPTRGKQSATDIASNNAHDAHHHLWDIARSLPG